jgi:hypothetical protein
MMQAWADYLDDLRTGAPNRLIAGPQIDVEGMLSKGSN